MVAVRVKTVESNKSYGMGASMMLNLLLLDAHSGPRRLITPIL